MGSSLTVSGVARRVVVIDDDANIRKLIEDMLPGPEFQVWSFGDPRDALGRLHEIRPELIVCDVMMPEMDGRTFFKVVKRSEQLRDVPFVFLSAIHSNDEIVQTLDAGADDFVNKPFHPKRLVSKIRATLRMVDRRSGGATHSDSLTGELGAGGALPLLKFCEDSRLSGRLMVEAAGQRRWADLLGGELVGAGGEPETAGVDPLDALLAIERGRYRIEQRRLDAGALKDAEDRAREDRSEPTPAPASETPLLPGGRLSRIDVRGNNVEIQTEGENRPQFTVTTVVIRGGQVLRKIESAWQHALQRLEDQELARSQIDRQHDRVVATIRELTVEGGRRAASDPVVDGALLAWAVSFVAEQARNSLGAVMTVALLRRTHKRLARERETLRSFRVAEDGRVAPDPAAVSLPGEAVRAVAEWTATFLAEAGAMAEKVRGLKIRQATRMMEADLEAAGFYAAVEAAQRSAPPS